MHSSSLATPEPRRWQREALDAWLCCGRRGIIEVVTGGGKTFLAILCIRSLLEELPNLKVIIAVPTQALLDQWYVTLKEDGGFAEEQIGLWSGLGTGSIERQVHVMVFNTARWAAGKILARGAAALIVDECHRVGSAANSLILSGDYTATLGMSATPEGEYDARYEEVLRPWLGPILYRYGLQEATADGVLVPFEIINVEVPLLDHERQQYSTLTRQLARLQTTKGLANQKEERQKILLRKRARVAGLAEMRIPVTAKIVESYKGTRTLVFHESIDHADRILAHLKARGHSATIYHSGLSPSLRRDNLRLFRTGVFDVLVTCRALDEGINIPEVRLAVVSSATASNRQRVQRLGRVLRPAPGKGHAIVYTIFATRPERERLALEASRLAGVLTVSWRKAKISRG